MAIAVLGLTSTNAQGVFNAGINVGLPVGDAGDAYTFSVLLDVNHLWEVSEEFDAGVASGYVHAFGDSIDIPGFGSFDVDDASFIPLAGAGRYKASDNLTLGAYLGYAIGISPNGNDGGFYYAPAVLYSISESIKAKVAYRGISKNGGSFDVLSLGIELGL